MGGVRVWAGIVLLVAISFDAAYAQLTPTFANVQFGTGTLDAGGTIPLLMDIYKPAGIAAPTPTVLWIHGGGWTGGNKNAIPGFMQDLVNNGVTVASINYRLSQEAIFPAQIQDVKGAVRFLRANNATYRVDSLRIGAWGTSAGGHLSALLAMTGGNPSAEGSVGGNTAFSSRILTAVDFFGPSDLLNMNLDVTTPPGSTIDHDAPDSPESRLIGFSGTGEGVGVLRANQSNPNPPYPQKMALVTLASPVAQASFDDPTMLISHGTVDTSVPFKQSQKLYDALNAAGAGPLFWPAEGFGHGFLGDTINDNAVAWMLASLRRQMADAI